MSEFRLGPLTRAAVDLADNEKVSSWEPSRAVTARFQKDAIHLDGKWRASVIGRILGFGIFGELLVLPFFLRRRTETIPVQNLERVVIRHKKKTVTFHLFQSRDHGMVEVYVFMADKNVVPQLIDALKTVVPTDLLEQQNAG